MNQIMKNKIIEILRGLMACGGVTNPEKEIVTENWLLDFFRQLPYFQKYPERYGRFPIPGDPLRRGTVWALVNSGGGGCGKNTAEGKAHGAGKRLEDTNDSGGTLDDTGNGYSGEESEKIVVFKCDEQMTQRVAHRADRGAHICKSDE